MATNPLIGDSSGNDLEQMKGDRIGNTMYSERSVIKTLMKLSQISEFSSELEEELCLLWDMTVEEDVANFLLKNNFLDLATHTVMATEDNRLIEIVIGIIGNMCHVKAVRSKLAAQKTAVEMLMKLFGIRDAPVLIQLARVFELVIVDIIDKPSKSFSSTLVAVANEVEHNNQKQSADKNTAAVPTSSCDERSIPTKETECDTNNWWEIYLYNTEIWFHNIPSILRNCKNDELLFKLWHLVDKLSDVACDNSIYLDEYFLNEDLLQSLVISFNEFFQECHPTENVDSNHHLRKAASNWIIALDCFHNYEEGTDIIRKSISEVLPCIQHMLDRFSINFIHDAESNKLLVSLLHFLEKSLPTYRHAHISEVALKKIEETLKHFLQQGTNENTDWETATDESAQANKRSTTSCIEQVLRKIKTLYKNQNLVVSTVNGCE